jgi:hypothetical protein
VVRRRYPDLIAILPEVGVLVIEVKDWRLAEMSRVTPETVAGQREVAKRTHSPARTSTLYNPEGHS